MKKLFECEYGFREVEKYDTTNSLMEPGEKIVAKKINDINEKIICFREYNMDDLSRADFVIYKPNDCLIILEVKDWDNTFIKNITGQPSGLLISTPFGNKNPYKNQLLKYARRIAKKFKDSLFIGRSAPKQEIPIYLFTVFTKYSFEDLKNQAEKNWINSEKIENFKNYTIFSDEIIDLWSNINSKISNQSRNNKKNEIGIHNVNLKYVKDYNKMLEIFLKHNSLALEKPLDKKQIEISQSIDDLNEKFIFIYGTAGSGKSLILRKRISIFKLKKQFEEIDESKKMLLIMKDDHSLLFKEYEEANKKDIIILPLLQNKYGVKITEQGIYSNVYNLINWVDIEEVLIEEGHTIISNSKFSFDKLKELITAGYINGGKNKKIIMTLDCNQIQYKNFFRAEIGNIRKELGNKLGLNNHEYKSCELNISYRLSNLSSKFSFQYFVHYMKSYNLLNNVIQVNSPESPFGQLKRGEYYDGKFCDEGFENELKKYLKNMISELKHNNNLIIFLDNISHLNLEESDEVQIIDSILKIDCFNSNKKVTITDKPEYIAGLEFENVIIVSRPQTFFLENYFGDALYEQLYKNYISLTRSTGEMKFIFFNRNYIDNFSSHRVTDFMNIIQNGSTELLDYYR